MRADLRANTPKVGIYKLPNSKGITNAARNSCLTWDHRDIRTQSTRWSAIWWQVICGNGFMSRNRLINTQSNSG